MRSLKINRFIFLILLSSILLLGGCTTKDNASNGQDVGGQTLEGSLENQDGNISQGAMTLELINMVEGDENLKAMLEKSIERAKEINPDKKTNPVQTLNEYYEYISWAETAMPWNITKDIEVEGFCEKIDQCLNYFYFINDQPLEELEGRGLYNNSLQYSEPYRTWLVDFTKSWGDYLSTEASWNHDYYMEAYEDERFGLKGEWYEEPENWKTFNDFISRNLSSADMRKISGENDPSVVVAPADSTPQGVWNIDENGDIIQKEGAIIKSKKFNSIADLIGPDSEYKDEFNNGVMTHTFLDIYDYHRYHFPIGGTIKEVNHIEGDCAVGGFVTWDKESESYILNSEAPGWQMIESRGVVIIENEDYGLVALIPVGMNQTSSVNFSDTIKVGESFKKGDELGYFLFGGSDFVMIFQEKAGFSITAPLEKGEMDSYEHIMMGEEYGSLSLK